jgi:hypothetical protein
MKSLSHVLDADFNYRKESVTLVAAIVRSDSRIWLWLAYLID